MNAGGGVWWAVGGSLSLQSAGIFSLAPAATGYQKLPHGLIIQWGAVATSSSGSVSVPFPIAFPSGIPFACFASLAANSVAPTIVGCGNTSSTGLTVVASNTSGAGIAANTTWLAIGH